MIGGGIKFEPVDLVEIFDMRTMEWKTAPPLPEPHKWHIAIGF